MLFLVFPIMKLFSGQEESVQPVYLRCGRTDLTRLNKDNSTLYVIIWRCVSTESVLLLVMCFDTVL